MRHAKNILGLAVSDREVSCALVAAGERPRVLRLGRFLMPAGLSVEQPEELGRALASFLRAHHLYGRGRGYGVRAVIGVPAKWLLAEEREVPPADEAQTLAALRMHAERIAADHNGDLVFDTPGVTGGAGAAGPTRALLIGIMRPRLERLAQMCEAAGLKRAVVTPASLAFAAALGPGSTGTSVILGPQAAEVVWQVDGLLRGLRHLPASASGGAAIASLAGELRRATAGAAPGGAAPPLSLRNGCGLTAADVAALSERIGAAVRPVDSLAAVGAEADPAALNGAADQATSASFLPAIALAIEAGRGRAGIDFLRPRLAPLRVARIGRQSVLAAAAALLAAVGLAVFYFGVRGAEAEALGLEARVKEMAPAIKAAQSRVDRFGYGRGYFDGRPPVLDCLREVTLAFRPEDAIWATQFALRETGKGQLQGRAADQRTVLAVLDRLRGNPRFADVQLQDMRDAAGASRDVPFSITFTYTGGA